MEWASIGKFGEPLLTSNIGPTTTTKPTALLETATEVLSIQAMC